MLEKKYKIFILKRFLQKTQLQLVGGLIILAIVTICVLTVDSSTQTILTNLGFTLLLLLIVFITLTSLFRSNAYIGIIMILILAIAGAQFNSLVRGAEYSLLYTVIILLVTTNYNITYNNVQWLVGFHFLGYVVVQAINYNSFEGYLWATGSSSSIGFYAMFSLCL